MTTYWITFRIAEKTVAQRTYEERYQALQDAILGDAIIFWSEPTSFIAFESAKTIDALAQLCKSAVAPSQDLFLIRQIDKQNARICGQFTDKDILKLMPYVKVV